MAKVPDVEIDPEGKFKYILVRVKIKGGTEHKDIVRGTKSAEYHSKSSSRAVCLVHWGAEYGCHDEYVWVCTLVL